MINQVIIEYSTLSPIGTKGKLLLGTRVWLSLTYLRCFANLNNVTFISNDQFQNSARRGWRPKIER